jgi:acetylornithine deacetylase/succinyl-diaminopimelate desuccinylase-like protein
VDDKGQLWMEIKAVEALMRANSGKLPLNVKFIIEGEEEVGGESIAAYVRAQKDKLKADFALVCDTELFAPNLPTLCVGLRGLVYTEIEARGPKTDLHSGMYGGAAPNPFFALIEIISKLKDSKGKILIPGFYKGVKSPSKEELKAWNRLPFKEEHYRKTEVGSKVLTGEPGYGVLYRTWARPTLEVHGMPGGFTAPGAKTVIPAKGSAKVSMRLVPDQDADDILKKYTDYVAKITPKGITSTIKVQSGPTASRCSAAMPVTRTRVPTSMPPIRARPLKMIDRAPVPSSMTNSSVFVPASGCRRSVRTRPSTTTRSRHWTAPIGMTPFSVEFCATVAS